MKCSPRCLAALCAVGLTLSCDATGPAPVVSDIALTPNQDSIFTGDTIQFLVTAFDRHGRVMPTPSLMWTSSSPGIAAVSQTGQVVALARGSAVISASDGASVGTAAVTVLRRDSIAPSLTVDAPINYTVGRPEIRLTASCMDDDPLGCEIVVRALYFSIRPQSTEIARTRDVLDTVVSLIGFPQGSPMRLSFSAHDPVNASWEERVVIVETSAALSPELDVAGRIIDADEHRVLYVDATDSSTVRIHDRITGTDQVIIGPAALRITYGALTSAGALLVNMPGFLPARILEWRGSGVIDHGHPDAAVSIRVAGDHAIWSLGPTLIHHDIAAGTSTVVASDAGNWANDVAANGDVVYWSHANEIIRYRQGVATPLANEGGGTVWHYGVRTDGSLVVFTKRDPCCAVYHVIVLSDGRTVNLMDASTFTVAGTHYQVRAGRVAYTPADAGGLRQVWTWTPAEGARQITSSTWSELESMGPAGEIVVNTAGKRLLWTPTGSGLRDIGGANGTVQWIGADPYIVLGRTLFRVN